VLLAGRAQVHVRVDEAREQMAALAVEDLAALGRLGAADLRDHAVADEHVERLVDPLARVEHVRAADQDLGRRGFSTDEAHAGCGVERGEAASASGAPRPTSSS
jgi:hypothetical protein